MRYYIYISIIAVLSVFCFNNAMGQGVTVVGNNNVNGKTLIKSDFALSKLSNADSGIVYIGADSIARILPLSYVKGGGGGSGSVDSVTISNDSLFYWGGGVSFFVGIVNSGGSVDTTGLSDRINYNLTRINALSDSVGANRDSINVHRIAIDGKEPAITPGTTGQYWQGDKTWQDKSWLPISTAAHSRFNGQTDSIVQLINEVAGIPIIDSNLFVRYSDTIPSNGIATKDYVNNAIPAASGLQQVLDNGDTSNRDFVINRSSYTGTTKIGDGDGVFLPPNSSRVSFYVSSKTSGQGAGSGVGYGIQAVAEYIDTVGFLSSTTLQGATGSAVASSSTSSGGLDEHDFTNAAAGANMAGLIGSAFTYDSAYTTSAAAVVGLVDAVQQSHMRFATNFLSVGTKRRTGTVIDSLAGVFIQQRNSALGNGVLGQNYGIWIDSMIGGTNNYGLFFKNNPNGGSIASAAGHDISIKSGAATKIHSPTYLYDTVNVSDRLFVGTTEDYKPISIQVIGDSRDASVFGGIAPLKIWPQRVANLMGANLNQALAQPSTFFMNYEPRFNPLDDTSAVMDVILTDKIKSVAGLSDSDYYLIVTRCINDLHWYTTEDSGYNYTPENFGNSYRIFMDSIVNRGYDMDKVLLMGPKYVLPNSAMVIQDSVYRWIDTVRQIATDYGCKFFDAFHWEQGRGGASLLDIDDFHENETGHAVLAKGVIVALAAPVKRNGQNFAVNGTAEFNRIIFRGGNDSSTQNSWVMMVNAEGEVFTSGNKVIWNNSPDSLRQEADINVSKIKGRSLEATGLNSVSLKIGNNTAIQGSAASGGVIYLDASANTTGTANIRAGSTTTFNSTEVSSTVPFRSALMWVGTAVQGNSASNGTLYVDASKNTTGTVNIRAGATYTFNSSGFSTSVGLAALKARFTDTLTSSGNVYFSGLPKAATKDSVVGWESGRLFAMPKPTGGSADSSIFFTNYRADTMRTNIYGAISANGLAWSDTNILGTKYDIDTVNAKIPDVSGFISWTDTVSDIGTKHDIDTLATSIYGAGYLTSATAASTYVPNTRTINGNALSSNVTLDAGDIDPVTNRNYVTDAQLTVIGNTSGTNTGDQTSVTGNAGTATALQTGRTINGVLFDGTANIKIPVNWQGKLAGETDTLTTGVKLTFRFPCNATLTDIKAAVNAASSSGNVVIDVKKNGTTIMSTNKITIEATETSSRTATTPPGLTTTSVSEDDIMTVEITSAGTNAICAELTIEYEPS